MYIPQLLFNYLNQLAINHKAWIIYGPRRVGKSTLLKKLLEARKESYLLVDGEDINVQHYLSSQSIDTLKTFVGNHQWLAIDEAQKIPNIRINLKLLVDHCPNLQVIATGSSAFDLANHLGEPLTGRKMTFHLFPLSQMEMQYVENNVQTRAHLESRLIYGSYPEVVLTEGLEEKKKYLRELISDYLYKDILELEGIRRSRSISQLLQLLAFQIGKEVSHSELGQQLGLNKGTVARYLDLLEKSFVLINIKGFNRNLRKEISKQSRYYFYDNGIRNAIINQFNPLGIRNDVGELWENYVIIERLKKQHYRSQEKNNYFWRTYDQQEIDWIEEGDGELHGYEIKWQPKSVKEPSDWKKTYPNATFSVIHQENYLDFII